MNAGHFCRKPVISALELLVTSCQPWVLFFIHLLFLLSQQDMTFSKQVLIKHFVSATERGLQRLETANLVSVTGFAEYDRDDCMRSLRGRLFIFTTPCSLLLLRFSCLHFLGLCHLCLFSLHHVFSFFSVLGKPSGVLSTSPSPT